MIQPGSNDDLVLDYMEKKGMPMTRETYIDLAYLGEIPEPWTAEHEAELPEQFQEGGG